MGENGKEAEG